MLAVTVKVALHLVEARRTRLASLLRTHRYLPLKQVCQRLKISEATARRDLKALVETKKVTRTYGGALADFNFGFTSFADRQQQAPRAKAKIAATAVGLLQPGMTCYLDAGTTMLHCAEALRLHPVEDLTVVTNNLPVAETLAEMPGLQVHLLGGLLLKRQSILLGDKACRNAKAWKFDVVLLSGEGMSGRGVFNSQADVVRFQRTVARQAERVVLCLDASKLGHETEALLLPWSQIDLLLTDAQPKALKKNLISLRANQLVDLQT